MYYYLALILCFQRFFIGVSGGSNSSFEHIIRARLLNDYDRTVVPVLGRKSLVVSFEMKIVKLKRVDTIAQTITLGAWVRQAWKNEFLQWNKTDFNDVDVVHFRPDEIWLPDITLLNNVDENVNDKETSYGKEIGVNYDGTCVMRGPATFKASCQLDFAQWPFDNQTCLLSFGSFTYGKDRLLIKQHTVVGHRGQLSDRFVKSGDWQIDDVAIALTETSHDQCCNINFIDVVYTIKITRKPLYYVFYLVMPTLLLLFLNLTSFLIPVESGERIGFVTTILLAMTVFLLLMSSLLPETSSGIPLLGFSMAATLIIMCLVLLSNILVLKLFFMEGSPPEWVQSLFRLFKKRDGKRVAQIQDASRADVPHLPRVEFPGNMHVIQASELPEEIDKIHQGSEEKGEELTWKKVSIKLDSLFFALYSLTAMITYAVIYF